MIENNFIIPVDRVTGDAIPIPIKTELLREPLVDMVKLLGLYNGTETEFPKNECYWKVNFERFMIEYRFDRRLLLKIVFAEYFVVFSLPNNFFKFFQK